MIASPDKVHHIGKVVFAPSPTSRLTCIDGQQRLITTTMLLASIRHALPLEHPHCPVLDRLLFIDSVQDIEHVRIIPSSLDRAAFFSALHLTHGTTQHMITQAKSIFDARVARMPPDRLLHLSNQLLDGFNIVHVTLEGDFNQQQVFLWLSEKAVFAGIMLANSAPGVTQSSTDLLRNFLLSNVMDAPREYQEHVFEGLWMRLERSIMGEDDQRGSEAAFDVVVRRWLATSHVQAELTKAEPAAPSPMSGLSLNREISAQIEKAMAIIDLYHTVVRVFDFRVKNGRDEQGFVVPGGVSRLGVAEGIIQELIQAV